MTDSIQLPAISCVTARPTAKRVVANVAAATTGAVAPDTKSSNSHVGTPQPVEPVIAVEPATQLIITRDEAANTFVYKSIDRESGEVVWQYPVEQVLRLAHHLRELEGLDEHQIDARA